MRPAQPPPRQAEPARFRGANSAEATDALPARRAVAKNAARMQEATNKAAPANGAATGPTPAAAGDGDGDGAAATTVGRKTHVRAVSAHLAAPHGAPWRLAAPQKAGARRAAAAAPEKKERPRAAPAQKPRSRQTERAEAACDEVRAVVCSVKIGAETADLRNDKAVGARAATREGAATSLCCRGNAKAGTSSSSHRIDTRAEHAVRQSRRSAHSDATGRDAGVPAVPSHSVRARQGRTMARGPSDGKLGTKGRRGQRECGRVSPTSLATRRYSSTSRRRHRYHDCVAASAITHRERKCKAGIELNDETCIAVGHANGTLAPAKRRR